MFRDGPQRLSNPRLGSQTYFLIISWFPEMGGGGGESRVRALRWLPREVRGRVRSEGPGERLTGWEHDCGYKLQQQVAGWHRAGLEGWSRRLELGI